ncbi:unnamed protein product [Pleuronectes platessa]|uniref:Uncharacterized protein n=1 Tax=Pleuronectes platessa TaxID=8262 RepID=A0A9N7V9U4_PLEPL|nr:unnamed protein product [Pleuronectes platessa]
MLFIVYSSAFNTIVPLKLITKLRDLGLNIALRRKAATASLSTILRWPAGCPASLLLHRQGGGLADPASFSIQPTTRGQSCSSQLIFKEISSPFKLYKTPRSDAMSCRKTSTSI